MVGWEKDIYSHGGGVLARVQLVVLIEPFSAPPLLRSGEVISPQGNPGCTCTRNGSLRYKAVSGAWSKEAGAWRREVAERRPFSASPAAEKGSQIAKRNS